MPLSLAFSTPLKSRSLPLISLIFTDSYCYKLVFIRAIRVSYFFLERGRGIDCRASCLYCRLEKIFFCISRSYKLVLIRAIRGQYPLNSRRSAPSSKP